MSRKLKFFFKAFAISLSLFALFLMPLISHFDLIDEQKQISAQVEEKQQIIIDLQGGKLNDKEEDIKIDANDYNTLSLDVPTRENYAFYGYFSQPNAEGTKYYNYLGIRLSGVSLEENTPEKLYAAWVKTVSVVNLTQQKDISYRSGEVYTKQEKVGLDIAKLKEIGYQQIEVNMKYTLRAEDKGTGRDMWFDLITNGSNSFSQKLLDNEGMYYTEWTDSYASVYIDIGKFDNQSKFQFGFEQLDYYFLRSATWKFKESTCYFSAGNKTIKNPLTSNYEKLGTNLYTLEDNTGYNINDMTPNGSPIGGSYARIGLHINGGDIIKGEIVDGVQRYGFSFDDKFNDEQSPSISLKLNFNYPKKKDIFGSSWDLSEDTYHERINGIEGVGVVQSGALLVQKLKQGGNPSLQEDWTWENPLTNGVTQSFHSVDFVNNYNPKEYNGFSHFVKRIEPVIKRNDEGGYVYKYKDDKVVGVEYVKSDGYFVTQDVYKPIDGFLPIFTPSGEDLKNGAVLRVLFVYEIKSGKQYKNIVEETTFALYPSTAKVLFQNMDFYTLDQDADNSVERTSELVRKFGEVKDDHSVNDGFRVDFNGNTTYTVEYYKNNATNTYEKKYAHDGQVFVEPGKYRFIVTPVVGDPKETTIYINERGLSRNLTNYFGDGLISPNSQRVFSQVDSVPVYLKNETYWQTQAYSPFIAPLVGRIGLSIGTLDEKKELEIDSQGQPYYQNYIVYENQRLYENTDYFKQSFTDDDGNQNSLYFKIIEKIDATDRAAHSGKFSDEGFYLCEFANNKDFIYNQTEISGDVYLFTFQFEVVDEGETPQINENLLNSNLSFVDYKSKYYGVTIPTKGNGNVIYAFDSHQEAYNFAYDYYRSLAQKTGNSYIFNNQTFASPVELFKEIQKVCDDSIEEKYFDASDKKSYLTISENIDDATKLNLSQDVIVFDTSTTGYFTSVGEPFLNDRPYAYIKGDGVEEGFNQIQFVQISQYETSKIKLTHLTENISYEIPYGVSVQSFLMKEKAPSGRYKIIEENPFGVSEYYGIYVAPGENTTNLDITRVNGKIQTRQNLSVANANIRFENINGMILHSATNELDPYGIIKIKNLTTGETVIKQLDEVDNYKIETQGHYQIDCVDRLGNVISYFADIYDSSKFYNLTFKNEEEVESVNVAGGTRVNLSVPENNNGQMKFVGWQDEAGKVLTGEYFYFDYTHDVTLTALWHYKDTKVVLYDGTVLGKYNTSPGEALKLKDLYGQKQNGLTYFRYIYQAENGEKYFYLPEMQFVPNAPMVRLDTLWLDEENLILAKNGDALPAPTAKEGYNFYGYIYSTSGVQHYLFEDHVEWPNEDELTLYALYTKDSSFVENGAIIFPGNSSSNISLKLGNVFGKSAGTAFGGIVGILFISLILALVLKEKQPKLRKNSIKDMNFNDELSIEEGSILSVSSAKEVVLLRKPKIKRQKHKKFTFGNFIKPATCFALAFAFLFICCHNLMLTSKFKYDISAAEAAVERELDEYQNSLNAEWEAFVEQQEITKQETLHVKELVLDEQNFAEEDSKEVKEDYSEEEAFLYGLIYAKLNEIDYTVFAATATNPNGKKINGLAYYNPNKLDYYSNEDDDILYVSVGFVGFLGQEVVDFDGDEAILIEPKKDSQNFAGFDGKEFKFVLGFGEELAATQYIANQRYVVFSVHDFIIDIAINEFVGDGTLVFEDSELYSKVQSLGYLYNYDTDAVMYDYVGQDFEASAYSIISGIDYDAVYEAYMSSLINFQNENYAQVDSMSIVAISVEAIHEYVIHNQDETYLGLDTEQIYQIESQLEDARFYYINGETGSISQLSVAERLQQYKDEHDGKVADTVWTILSYILSGISIISGIILCCLPFGTQGMGISLIVGGLGGVACEIYKEDISKFMLNAFGQKGAQAIGAAGSIVIGGTMIKIGSGLMRSGPGWVKVLGVLLCLIGFAGGTFATSELSEVFFDFNFMKEWFGMSDLLYSNIYRGINYVATLIIILNLTISNIYKYIQVKGLASSIGKTVKELFKTLSNETGLSIKQIQKMSASELKACIEQLKNAEAQLQALADAGGKTLAEVRNMSPDELKAYIDDLNQQAELKPLADAGGKTVQELRQMDEQQLNKYINRVRSKAVRKAKMEEIELLKAQKEYFDVNGCLPPDAYGNIPNEWEWGSLKNLTTEQVEAILKNGKFPSNYQGHHIYSVDFAKKTGKYSTIVDPNNIAIGERTIEHFRLWHNGNWQNNTNFITTIYGEKIYNINRTNLLENIRNIIGRK